MADGKGSTLHKDISLGCNAKRAKSTMTANLLDDSIVCTLHDAARSCTFCCLQTKDKWAMVANKNSSVKRFEETAEHVRSQLFTARITGNEPLRSARRQRWRRLLFFIGAAQAGRPSHYCFFWCSVSRPVRNVRRLLASNLPATSDAASRVLSLGGNERRLKETPPQIWKRKFPINTRLGVLSRWLHVAW